MTIRPAALFDMDRTLVSVNTGNLYIKWRYQRREAGLRDVAKFVAWMTQYTLGVIDPVDVTSRALRLLEGVEEHGFREECRRWYEAMVRPHISDNARDAVERHRRRGEVVAILSASTPYATQPLADDLGIEHVLCTQLIVRDGRFTGTYDELCYGQGKVDIAERWASEHGVDLSRSTFYTDSVSDLPMLERVGAPRIVNPDPRLRLHALRRRWPVEKWR